MTLKIYIPVAIVVLHFIVVDAFAQSDTTYNPLTIGITTQLNSASLNETRKINIYLPDEYYYSGNTARYPVIYIPDGGLKEDFLHIAGLVQYASQSWVHRLPKSIVVGIENTNRQRDFTYPVPNLNFLQKAGFQKKDIPKYGGSSKYIFFLQNELQPYINSHFRTNNNNTIVGESLAGLLVTEIYARHRGLFNNYIIISPALWWGNEQLLKEIKGPGFNGKVNVYIGAAKRAEAPVMYNDAFQLYKEIRRDRNTKVAFDYLPLETHATVIHQAIYNAFKWLEKK